MTDSILHRCIQITSMDSYNYILMCRDRANYIFIVKQGAQANTYHFKCYSMLEYNIIFLLCNKKYQKLKIVRYKIKT